MYRIYLGSLYKKVKNFFLKSALKILLFFLTIGQVFIASSANAGYFCTVINDCTMTWQGTSGTLTCTPRTNCDWYPDPAPQPTPPPPPPPPPPTPSAPAMTPEQRKQFCDTAAYEIRADRQTCDAEVDLKRSAQDNGCRDHGTLDWNFNYTGVRMSVKNNMTFSYYLRMDCQKMVISYSNYTKSICAAEENRARGRAVGICGPIQW